MAAKVHKRYYLTTFFAKGWVTSPIDYRERTEFWNDSVTDTRVAGFAMPNWRQKIKNRQSATTDVNGVRWTCKQTPGKGVLIANKRLQPFDTWTPKPTYWFGNPWPTRISGAASSAVITDGVAEREASKKFFRKYNQVTRGLDGLVGLGELRETLRMLRNPAKSLFDAVHKDYFDAVKRLKKSGRLGENHDRWRKALGGLWLEHAFGWMPFLNDISGVLDALDLYNSDPVVVKMITAVGKQTKHQSTFGSTWSPTDHYLTFRGFSKEYLRQKVKYRGMYARSRTEIKNLSKAKQASEAFGLELSQFVPALWELLPWSFLVDYFTNVGDILEQSFTDLRKLAWCNKTVIDEGVYELKLPLDARLTQNQNSGAFWTSYVSHTEESVASVSVTRTAFARSTAYPSVNSIRFDLPGTPQKWLNMTALAVTANSIYPQKYFHR